MKHRVLIVDDHIPCLETLSMMLKRMNVESDTVQSEQSCFEQLGKLDYDLIFLDLHLPKCSGFQIAPEILKNYEIPIVAYTADNTEETLIKARSLGIRGRLLKPIRMSDLQNLLSEILTSK